MPSQRSEVQAKLFTTWRSRVACKVEQMITMMVALGAAYAIKEYILL